MACRIHNVADEHIDYLEACAAEEAEDYIAARQAAATFRKEIIYDRETRDYAMYLDGELVGFARTYHEAEIALDNLVFELMSGQYFAGSTPAAAE